MALGYDSLDGYLLGQQSMGAIIGRWAGRLRSGRLSLPEGEPLQLPTNSGPHHHHGGPRGSRFQVFEVGEVHANAITLQHVFRTEDDGVPGTVRLVLSIALSPDNALSMTWSAEAADAPTIVNITGHAFFNLAAVLTEPLSGRSMEVWTTAPGVQVYAGHGLKADPARDLGRGAGADGWLWQPGDGICLEPMEFPDAPNHPAFPVRWMAPGDVVHGRIVYRFL